MSLSKAFIVLVAKVSIMEHRYCGNIDRVVT